MSKWYCIYNNLYFMHCRFYLYIFIDIIISLNEKQFYHLILRNSKSYFYRCKCGNCDNMPTLEERVCCRDLPQVIERLKDHSCIIDLKAFASHCSEADLLQTCYKWFRQDGGQAIPNSNRYVQIKLV